MKRSRILWIISLVLLAGSLPAPAQSWVGDYHGTALVDPTRGASGLAEFFQSVDLGLSIAWTPEGDYSGSVSFRRMFRNRQGERVEARGPLASLIIQPDGSFAAVSAPIDIRLDDGRLVERTVRLAGSFRILEGAPCIPIIQADYSETLLGLTFRPLEWWGPLEMARKQDTPADDACLGPVAN